jgi:hypothetical protein
MQSDEELQSDDLGKEMNQDAVVLNNEPPITLDAHTENRNECM